MEERTTQKLEANIVQPPNFNGDFAQGLRTMPKHDEVPNYARGQALQTLTLEGPDFARGERTQPPMPDGPDYARGLRQTDR